VQNTHIIVSGGYSGNWYTRVELLNFQVDNLQVEYCNHDEEHLPNYPYHVEQAVSVVIEGKVTVCGGRSMQFSSPTPGRDCNQLDNTQIVWKPFPILIYPRVNSGNGIVEQGWWVIGGDDSNGKNTTEIFKNGAWQLGPNIPRVLDYWSKPCVVNINATHTFVAGGDANGDTHTTWIYNWADDTWTIQDFVPLNIINCVPVTIGGMNSILAGYNYGFAIFDLQTNGEHK
jgi:hypothetical protein